jgi:hypothetical protein
MERIPAPLWFVVSVTRRRGEYFRVGHAHRAGKYFPAALREADDELTRAGNEAETTETNGRERRIGAASCGRGGGKEETTRRRARLQTIARKGDRNEKSRGAWPRLLPLIRHRGFSR